MRIPKELFFEDYNLNELYEIAVSMAHATYRKQNVRIAQVLKSGTAWVLKSLTVLLFLLMILFKSLFCMLRSCWELHP